ncbi:aminodeoxychorismate lyase [Alteromonas pelagimontana]|uniref:Aminodeoxychorismate lyase n=1 Tax=Alteromonas pelagimontana TaxID=1858656 RepID=A0A6M4M8H8_9ALTE|nr:aminodeoxychorismate lyase [Alteromonas pelagimontana]QJR79447.1 aminodeoxychorismate lyase [Alteromonas pelagimontana]
MGQIIAANSFDVGDRAANYGDGLFTTMQVEDGRVALFNRHVSRMMNDGERLMLTLEQQQLETAIRAHAHECGSGVLKLLISSGVGGRGYARPETAKPHMIFSHHPLPGHYTRWRSEGIRTRVSSVRLAIQPLLGGIKHLNRLEQIFIKKELNSFKADDAIVCDADGFVIEGSAANIFWHRNGQWHTPEISTCGVKGVMRCFLLDWFEGNRMRVNVGRFVLDELFQADTVFFCNALMEIIPVTAIASDSATFDFPAQPVRVLQQAVAQNYKDEYDSGA